jgi:hypothetical protein
MTDSPELLLLNVKKSFALASALFPNEYAEMADTRPLARVNCNGFSALKFSVH